MPNLFRTVFIVAALAALTGADASPASPPATAAQTCKPPKYPGNGYFTSLRVSRTSCAEGRRVTMAYYRCRTRNGIRGRCKTAVLGFHCREVRQSIPTEFDAKVTCKRGPVEVIHTYQQNT